MQMVQIQPCMFSNYTQIKLEIHNKDFWKIPNFGKKNNILLNNLWIKEEIKTESRKYFELIKNENRTHKYLWDATKEVLVGGRSIYRTKCFYQKRMSVSNQ